MTCVGSVFIVGVVSLGLGTNPYYSVRSWRGTCQQKNPFSSWLIIIIILQFSSKKTNPSLRSLEDVFFSPVCPPFSAILGWGQWSLTHPRPTCGSGNQAPGGRSMGPQDKTPKPSKMTKWTLRFSRDKLSIYIYIYTYVYYIYVVSTKSIHKSIAIAIYISIYSYSHYLSLYIFAIYSDLEVDRI